jgi:arylsulfatase A-like enzyme
MNDSAVGRPLLAAWCRRSLIVGGMLGLLLAMVSQFVLAWQERKTPGHGVPLLLHHVTAVLAAGGAFTLVGLLGGALSAPMLRLRRGRALAAAFISAGLTLATAHHVLATRVRVLSGTLPTLSGVEMFLAIPSQFFHAALVGHQVELLFLVSSTSVLAVGLFLLLVRNSTLERSRVLSMLGLGAAGLFLLLINARALHMPAPWELMGTSPELMLLSSLEDSLTNVGAPDEAGSSSASLVPPGPPLSAGQDWIQSVRDWRGPRPNVLLILLESVPADHLGYAGYTHAATPNIDRLAARSLRFRNAWSTATTSSYAQMALLSSLVPRRWQWLEKYEQLTYPRMLFHDVFHTLGYTTATLSSQDENWLGMRRFQNTGTPTFYQDSNDHPGSHINEGMVNKLPDHVTVDIFLNWMHARTQQPWAAYLNFQRTHFPYQLPPGFTGRHQPSEPTADTFGFLHYPREELDVVRNRYDNALEYVDAQVGRILSDLESSGQLDDTLIILSADHGEEFHESGLVTHGKALTARELRVPLLIHWPRHVESRDVDVPVSHLDVLPTVLDLLGVPPHPSFQGQRLADIERPGAMRNGLFLTLHGLRIEDGLVCWPWKIEKDQVDYRVLVHNLEEDPGETRDLFDPNAPIPAALLRMLSAQVDAQFAYHAPEGSWDERFAPRLLTCPDWSGFFRATAPRPAPETQRL